MPCDEEKIQKICDELDVKNSAFNEIKVVSVDDVYLEPYLNGMTMPLDELNFLEKRLDTFTADEMKVFYAANEVNPSKSSRDFINLTYNLHCHSLIDPEKDLKTLGRQLFLHEEQSCSTDELAKLNPEKYLLEFFEKYSPIETSHGMLYPNKNQPEEVFVGPCLPAFSYEEAPVVVYLTTEHPTKGHLSELLTLPYIGSDLDKIQERMGVETLQDIQVDDIHLTMLTKSNVLENLDLSHITTADDLEELSYVSEFYDRGTQELFDEIKTFCQELHPENLAEIGCVCSAVLSDDLELVECISTDEEYGYYLVYENDETRIDEDIAAFVDYDGYGESQLLDKTSISTESGLVIYHGEDLKIAEMLKGYDQRMEGLEEDSLDFEEIGSINQ